MKLATSDGAHRVKRPRFASPDLLEEDEFPTTQDHDNADHGEMSFDGQELAPHTRRLNHFTIFDPLGDGKFVCLSKLDEPGSNAFDGEGLVTLFDEDIGNEDEDNGDNEEGDMPVPCSSAVHLRLRAIVSYYIDYEDPHG
jgi:hypothetical protein